MRILCLALLSLANGFYSLYFTEGAHIRHRHAKAGHKVAKNPVLFDKAEKAYKETVKKKDIWMGIGEKVGLTGKAKVIRVDVSIHGNPHIHQELVIHVATKVNLHKIKVTRMTDSVLHHLAEGFIISEDTDGNTVFNMHPIPGNILVHAGQFFSNHDTGTIVSVVQGHQGDFHVEGILNGEYVIAPPGSKKRHRRDVDEDDDDDDDDVHTIYRQEESHDYSVDFVEIPDIFRDKSNWIDSYTEKPDNHPQQPNQINPQRSTGLHHNNPFQSQTLGARRGANIGHHTRRKREERPSRHKRHAQPSRCKRQAQPVRHKRYAESSSYKRQAQPVRRKRQAQPPVNIVEILAIIDKEMFQSFNFSMDDLGLFLLHYWQAVDFKFKTLKDPRIKLKIRQYGAFQFEQFQPFIEQNRVSAGSKQLSLHDTLRAFRDWMKNYETNKNFVTHDVAVLQTGEDLCERKISGCYKQTSGIGFVGGACISARRFPGHTYDVAITEIGKSFKGVLVTVHEIGHLLGSHHDGEGDSQACSNTSGFVMSYERDKAYNFSRFSECSKASIRRFLANTWYSQCLRETGIDGHQFPVTLPGQYMTIDQQCQSYTGGKPCPVRVYPLAERCERLCCEANGYRIKRREPAVDGTDCGDNKVCFNGECLPKTSIPV